MKALIIGLGKSGQSAADLLLKQGYQVVGVDGKRETLETERRFPVQIDSAPLDLSSFDLVVVSPGISLAHPLCKQARESGIELIGEAELALRALNKSQRCLAVTGSNGKTTVTMLIAHLLNASGRKARALGNIGDPLASYALAPNLDEILVVELSSFQLETLQTPIFDAGVILNITPNHLDRHGTMEEYARAKLRLAACLKEGAPLYLHTRTQEEFAHLLDETYPCYEKGSIATFSPLLYRELRGHDRKNALAAWTLVERLGVTPEQCYIAWKSFKKPSHRIEYVATIDGVDYYDDSKGTNIEAVMAAVETLSLKPIVLIAGGMDKGCSYAPWIPAFQEKVKRVIVIGQAAEKITQELGDYFAITQAQTLEEAVVCASAFAKTGEVVLLSPGCASYDQFRDYAHRGEEFQRIVTLRKERNSV